MNRRHCHGCGFLHGNLRRVPESEALCKQAGRTNQRPGPTGSAIIEVLISMSIMTIGIFSIVAGGRSVRTQAELASRRAAEALAAQQVLEHLDVGAPPDSSRVDTVTIGIQRVRIRIETRDSFPGLVWIRIQADAGAGHVPWGLETLRRIP